MQRAVTSVAVFCVIILYLQSTLQAYGLNHRKYEEKKQGIRHQLILHWHPARMKMSKGTDMKGRIT